MLIAALIAGSLVIARELHDSAQTTYLGRVIPLRAATRDLLLQLVNEETGVRGYVITGKRSSLAPYLAGKHEAAADRAVLEARAADDPSLAPLLRPVTRLNARLDVFFAAEIHLVAVGSAGRAAAQIEAEKTVFDGFRAANGAVLEYALARTAAAKHRQDDLFWRLAAIVGGAGVAALAVVGLLAWRVPQQAYRLLRSEQRSHAQTERLRREAEAAQILVADLSSSLTVDDVRGALGRSAEVLFGADSVGIGVADPATGSVVRWTTAPTSDELAALDEHEGSAVVADGQPRFVESTGGDAAVAVLPLAAPREQPRGYLAFHFGAGHRFTESEQSRLRVAAAQVETALLRAESHDRERRVAGELQLALLPASLPTPAGAQLVGFYQPGAEGTLVGGDWYDAVELEDGTIAASVGDVAGRGVRAAAQMGRLRHSYRAYALERRSPAEVLARLTRHLPLDGMATAICFDVRERRLRYCGAGHPPAILVDLDTRAATRLPSRSAPPLGIASPSDFVDTTVELPRHSLLFAYTDGLVEQPRVSLDDRIESLVAQLTGEAPDDLPVFVRRVAEAMLSGSSRSDDVAVLALVL